ncbi:NTP transferase domain-containing protein [Myxococcus stipitatus]|uniref:NTP transferase domain-containing protein n=1 Tax=Myxococcus stipitatus TaxID=83455 RepID=UPI001F374CD1|nr:NTP transferase domain-containing protein [Myxococcus stipitatus]MCE9668794.1 NTP transferase domain-containing protein [Myxococcus stipitatus]
MRPLHVLLPMAGLGSRFADAGFTTPKPLIPVDGMPMVLKALSSLSDWGLEVVHTAVVRRPHEEQFRLATLLREAVPGLEVVILEEMTRGAVETALAASGRMTGERGLLVMDCDLWFDSPAYRDLVRAALASDDPTLAGGLLTFPSQLPRYSYAKCEGDRVVRTAEKVVISDAAIMGAYFFATERHFLDVGRQLMDRPISEGMREYYLSLLYNLLLDAGGAVRAAKVSRYASFGTPEELRQYQAQGPTTP